MRGIAVLSATFFSLAGPALAGEISLSTPIDCGLGEDQRCYVQQFVDRDAGDTYRDFTCNGLSYDGHKGTDFALRSHEEISAGVKVTAAAPGIVRGVRDGMIDKVYVHAEDKDRVDGKDCGNGVVLAHEGGWETQYCHLREGSVAVEQGQRVEAGDVLGDVGMSGKAAFPHLHLSVRKDGAVIDPFAPANLNQCGGAQDTLWADPIAYEPGGLISVGFAPSLPEFDEAKAGTADHTDMPQSAPAMVLWGLGFGSRPGDVMRMVIVGPDGSRVFANDVTLERAQIQYFRAGGRKTANADWFIPGRYIGEVAVIRDGKVISDMRTEVEIR